MTTRTPSSEGNPPSVDGFAPRTCGKSVGQSFDRHPQGEQLGVGVGEKEDHGVTALGRALGSRADSTIRNSTSMSRWSSSASAKRSIRVCLARAKETPGRTEALAPAIGDQSRSSAARAHRSRAIRAARCRALPRRCPRRPHRRRRCRRPAGSRASHRRLGGNVIAVMYLVTLDPLGEPDAIPIRSSRPLRRPTTFRCRRRF